MRFSLDERMISAHGLPYDDPAYPELAQAEQDEIWQEALEVLASGAYVVLDWNLWSRARRAEWRHRAVNAGYAAVVHHVRVPIEVAVARAVARGSGPDGLSHAVDEAGVRHLASLLEAPATDEAWRSASSTPGERQLVRRGWRGVEVASYWWPVGLIHVKWPEAVCL